MKSNFEQRWYIGIAVYGMVNHWRKVKGLTQKELADKVGTQQSAIARLESGKDIPSLTFLMRVAEALDKTLELRFK